MAVEALGRGASAGHIGRLQAEISTQGGVRFGQALSVEPGVYVPGLRGSRHSDMVLASCPRDLES